jgi:hypothetical protein
MTLPTLKVLLDNSTGTFPFDISPYVMATDGYTVSRGRDDWQSSVTAGELGLTLNNSDGRFTPGSTLIASPSPIVVDQRIRVQETVNGVTYARFTGYVKAWPVAWPSTVPTFASVRLSAVDAQANLERRPLRSSVIEEIMADLPRAYYTLAEAAGSTSAGDTSSRQAPPLTFVGTGAAVVFGSGIGPTDGLTAATFAGGRYLSSTNPLGLPGVSDSYTVEAFIATTTVPTAGSFAYIVQSGGDGAIWINSAGRPGFSSLLGPVSIADGLTHHVVVTGDQSGITTNLYVDGVLAATTPGVGASAATDFSVGGPNLGSAATAVPFTGTISHAAVYASALSLARVASHNAARGNFVGETGTARITRIAGYAGVPVASLDPSLTNMAAGSTADSTNWNEIQGAIDAELGVGYIDGTGALTFHNRNRVVSKTTPDLLLTNLALTTDVAAVVDDQLITNYMEVTAEGTGGISLALSTTSQTSHGRYSGSRSYAVQTDAEALDRANWLVSTLAEPTPRYGTLTINLFGMTPAQASTVLAALDVDCWLRVLLMSPQTPGGTTADVIVEGWSETTTSDTWTIACNVVARSLFAPVWVFDTSLFDTTTRLYV